MISGENADLCEVDSRLFEVVETRKLVKGVDGTRNRTQVLGLS